MKKRTTGTTENPKTEKHRILYFMRKPLVNISLHNWLRIETIVIALGSVAIYELLDFVVYILWKPSESYDPISGLGMILPMGLFTGMVAAAFSRFLHVYISELTDGISKAAEGNFVGLNEEKGGPLSGIYHSFNLMCMELSSIDTMRNAYVNEFSHEFKTPLSSINGFANLLLDKKDENCSEEQVRQYLTIISMESQRLLDLTESQLLLTKLDTQQIMNGKEYYSLDEQIRHCVILFMREWEQKKLNVSLELDTITVYANPSLLHHVWTNLISNAVKYTPEGGEISISSSLSESFVSIHISDTGIGMTENEINHIFIKYYRVQKNIKGLGLGLSIVKRIVELSHGSITVKSSLGEGSIFTVNLPK